jgi:pantoate--beta-alanine ligase
MKILINNNDLNEALYGISDLGFVPTMGSLHKGHTSLIKRSLKECKKTIVSIFINPTQFDNKKDFKKYPKNRKKDLAILKNLKVDFVFIPQKKHVYNFIRKKTIKISKKDKIMCARFRKGHFEGVIDVMDRLTRIINPKKIFMGEKDFQQLYLVKNYIEKKFNSKVISCKTIRNQNQVALSSRNSHLDKNDLIIMGKIVKKILFIKSNLKNQKNIKKYLLQKKKDLNILYKIKIEYFELRNIKNFKTTNKIYNARLFIAYHLKKIRLIDNI